ncbi:MAG TPA: hypothetical protein VGI81_00075 [Tepidisphaeraceae bacterium]
MLPPKTYFRELYDRFGYPLTRRDAVPEAAIRTAERRLGVRVPRVLRDYYAIAGRKRRFAASHNRVLPPREWVVDRNRLVLMDENQVVVRWGVSLRNPDAADPPVSQGVHGDAISWYPEHRRCSVFLAVMLCYNAVSGGFRLCAKAEVADHAGYRFEKQGWTFYGEVNSLRAYARCGQVLCLLPPGDLPFMNKWSVLIGGKTKSDLQEIADEVGLAIDA